jgi:monofunctional biosynthetic peptidoglycan transglycosylase
VGRRCVWRRGRGAALLRKPAARLSAYEAARLAVMLPRPKYFEKLPNSAYVAGRAATIVARMGDAELP